MRPAPSMSGGRYQGAVVCPFHIERLFASLMCMKRCSRCGQWLDRASFTPNASRRDGLQTFCHECQRAYMREHYVANREYYLAKALRSNKKQRTWLRLLLMELKAVPCADCGHPIPLLGYGVRSCARREAFQRERGPHVQSRCASRRSCKM